MRRSIKLIGLDCGSTTTSLVVATATLSEGALGRIEVTDLVPAFRSPMVFTPFRDDQVDHPRLEELIAQWIIEARVDPADIFAGGALVTGLAARGQNAACLSEIVESLLADAVVATADDPALESWLAFMGNCHELSQEHPTVRFVNVDIGGGTTNLAWGIDGQVTATACLSVGARHFRFRGESYEIEAATPEAIALAEHLGIDATPPRVLDIAEVAVVTDWYVRLIEEVIAGQRQTLDTPLGRQLTQLGLSDAVLPTADRVTLSGGVGQLVYQALGQQAAATLGGQFGDLGGELAARVLTSTVIAPMLGDQLPQGLGRATVYGLLRHATELSGATIHLPSPQRLPLKNVPIVGQLSQQSSNDEIRRTLGLASRAQSACVRVVLPDGDEHSLISLAERIRRTLLSLPYPADRTLVLVTSENLGKALGGYVTNWGSVAVDLIVLDELPAREAQLMRVGRLCHGVVGVSMYGMTR